MRHPLARLIARTAVVAGVIASFAFPVLAQDGTGPMPKNAQPRSYEAVAGTCAPIAVPANAYLTNTDYGAAWVCERGFVKIDDRCDAVVLPANAYLDQASYGPGWSCERGYEPLSGACVAIDLPENAYLDRSGNRWSCYRGFRLSDGMCVLGR